MLSNLGTGALTSANLLTLDTSRSSPYRLNHSSNSRPDTRLSAYTVVNQGEELVLPELLEQNFGLHQKRQSKKRIELPRRTYDLPKHFANALSSPQNINDISDERNHTDETKLRSRKCYGCVSCTPARTEMKKSPRRKHVKHDQTLKFSDSSCLMELSDIREKIRLQMEVNSQIEEELRAVKAAEETRFGELRKQLEKLVAASSREEAQNVSLHEQIQTELVKRAEIKTSILAQRRKLARRLHNYGNI